MDIDFSAMTLQVIPHRGISKRIFERYKVPVMVDSGNRPAFVKFGYGSRSLLRKFHNKEFQSQGDSTDLKLFGQEVFPPGCNDSITICEGAYDAMALHEVIERPVVSVWSAGRARKDCEEQRDYLNSFKTIYLCFDSDDPGQKATREVAMLFDQNKVRVVRLGEFKDPNEFVEKGETNKLHTCWQNAQIWMPKDIVASWDQFKGILAQEAEPIIGTLPFKTLNEMSYGIRSGECLLFTAQEKVGKTEVIRAIEHHLLATTDHNMGIIHLEERERRSIQGLAGLSMGLPAHLPDSGATNEDVLESIRKLTRRDGRLHFYSHFGSDDPDVVLDVIRYLVAVRKCKFIFLDHITMLVTGFEDESERKKLDYLSTRLAMMTRELDFTLFLVSHVNDDGKTRGSRNIAKVADLLIHLDRNIESENYDERNNTKITVRGNRYAGATGPAGTLRFDPKTFSLKELELADIEASPGF